jgi:non-canonical purine NTP pyrophosphatase (RdgB/HAM1 family)
MKIKYVTGNQVKINFAKKQLDKYNIEIEQVRLEIDEIQSEDKFAVAIDKAKKAYEILKSPLFVTDTFWEISALNGFPGAFMKYINKWFSSEDFLALMKNKEDRTIITNDSIVYIDENGIEKFTDIAIGEIADEIYKNKTTNDSIDNLVKFNGKYLTEHHKENYMNFPKQNKAWEQFINFLKNKTSL